MLHPEELPSPIVGEVMEEKNGREGEREEGGGVPLTSSQSVTLSVCVCVTGPLCFLLMNSLVSVLKRTARVLSRLRATIRSLMALLTNI